MQKYYEYIINDKYREQLVDDAIISLINHAKSVIFNETNCVEKKV